jgi:hypothetical protein
MSEMPVISDRDSTARVESAKPSKPGKPFPEFPLYAHAAGYRAKKTRGRVVYFGPWDDPDAALRKCNEQKHDLHAGRKTRTETDGATVKDVCNAYLIFKATHAMKE